MGAVKRVGGPTRNLDEAVVEKLHVDKVGGMCPRSQREPARVFRPLLRGAIWQSITNMTGSKLSSWDDHVLLQSGEQHLEQ